MLVKNYLNEYNYYHYLYFIVRMTFITGKIACANVISDLYAMGVTDVDNILMLLAVSTKMTEKERDVVIPLIMRGFKVIMISSRAPTFYHSQWDPVSLVHTFLDSKKTFLEDLNEEDIFF